MFRSLGTGAIGVQVEDLADGLDLAARHGFAGYHFGIGEVAAMGAAQALELAEEQGVKLSAWGFPLDFRGDEGAYRAGMEQLPSLAQAAAAVGVLRTATWIMPASDELSYAENFAFHVERLKPAAAVLAAQGIRFGLEYVGPKTSWASKQHSFAHTMEQMLELCQAIGDNMGFLLDSWHWYTSHETVEDLRGLSVEQVVDVHVNDAPAGVAVDEQVDNVRDLPGATGVIDIAAFLGALQEIGYEGPVMVEPFSQRVREMEREEAVAATAAALGQVWGQAGLA
ncbi:MAG: sugar phosphate isomerase/epimerase family protein [Candidatus Latescibacterota bacterium]|nr:sugar phosphate isomerase/epimerase family protein [Candidatus Latescibacterota bacterium]